MLWVVSFEQKAQHPPFFPGFRCGALELGQQAKRQAAGDHSRAALSTPGLEEVKKKRGGLESTSSAPSQEKADELFAMAQVLLRESLYFIFILHIDYLFDVCWGEIFLFVWKCLLYLFL